MPNQDDSTVARAGTHDDGSREIEERKREAVPEHVTQLRALGFEIRRTPLVRGKRSRVKIENVNPCDRVISCYRGEFSHLTQHEKYPDRWDLWFTDGTRVGGGIAKGRAVTVVRAANIVEVIERGGA